MFWKRIGAVVLALSLLPFALVMADDDDGYRTPEDAIEAFVRAVANNDADDALEVFGVEQRMKRHDFSRDVERVQMFAITNNPPAPSDSEMFRDLDEACLEGVAARSVFVFCASFFVSEGLDGTPVAPVDDAWAKDYAGKVAPAQLRDLKVASIAEPSQMNDSLRAKFAELAKSRGYDEQVEREVVYQLGDKQFVGGARLVRIGDRWFMETLGSEVMGMTPFGAVAPR